MQYCRASFQEDGRTYVCNLEAGHDKRGDKLSTDHEYRFRKTSYSKLAILSDEPNGKQLFDDVTPNELFAELFPKSTRPRPVFVHIEELEEA